MLGLLIIAADQGAAKQPGIGTWAGDLCFLASGTLWGVFTWLMSHWRLDAVRTTGLITIVSSVVYVPLYAVLFDLPQMDHLIWLTQFAYQGMLGGALAVVFFAASVTRLGGGAAAVFHALVPPVAVLCAVPMTGQLPNLFQTAGLLTATAGLLVSLDLLGGTLRRWLRGPDRVTDHR
nr:DMT family transporter [Pseudosulfitobacter koreense]